MRRYIVRHVAIAALVRVGLILGGLLGLPAGCTIALVAARFLPRLADAMEGLGLVELAFLGQTLRLDLVSILRLDGLRKLVLSADERLALILLLTLVGVPLATAILGALAAAISGWGYNLFAGRLGGIEFELEDSNGSDLDA